MILKLPEHLDENEWFIIVMILLSIIMYMVLPKRFPTAITAMIVLYSIAMPKVLDHIIAVPPYNLYDVMDSNKYELFDFIMYAIYPPFGYLFIYIYDYFKIKGGFSVIYVIVWSFFSIGMEFIALRLHVFNYHGWKLIYSLPVYTVILILNITLFHFCMKVFRRHLFLDRNLVPGD